MTAASGAARTPTLDGLRGIAVLAVVIEHAWPTILPGGYAGVDVFFVLSGFLITRMLVGEVARSGTIDLVAFYARRVRRIIPAATLCVVVVVIVFTVHLGVGFGPDFRMEALSAALSVSNLLFVGSATDYFAADPSSSPFLHYWSLAVEEQFYLVWPALLLALVAIGRRAAGRVPVRVSRHVHARVARWLPIALVAAIGVLSLTLAVGGPETVAFFLLPHRAWELLVGGLLAWLQQARPWRLGRALQPVRWLLAAAGGAALAFTFMTSFDEWPGAATILPVFGTALLIAGGTAMPGARMLSMAWLRFFGRISYALYLWHWPILAAAALIALPASAPPLWMTAGAVLLAVLAAVVSTVVVEEPIRFSQTRWLVRGRALAAAGTVLAAASVVIALSTSTALPAQGSIPDRPTPGQTGPPSAPPDIRPQLATVGSDRERLIADGCYTKLGRSEVRSCVYGAAAEPDGSPVHDLPPGMPVAVLFGDSHAMHWFPAVNAWATQAGFALVPLTRSGCVAVDADVAVDQGGIDSCNTWRAAALARIAAIRPIVTVVSSSSGVNIKVDGVIVRPRTEPQAWIAPATRFLEQLAAIGGSIVYIGDVPRPGFEVPDCLAAHWTDLGACAIPTAEAQPPELVRAQAVATAAAHVMFVDPTPWLCSASTCTWILDGRIAYVDDHHMTASTALTLAPELAPFLSAAVDPPAVGVVQETAPTRLRPPQGGLSRGARSTNSRRAAGPGVA